MRPPHTTAPCLVLLAFILAACGGASSTRAPAASAGSSVTDAPIELSFAMFGGGGAHLDWMVAETQAHDDAHPELTIAYTQDSFYGPEIPYPKLQERYFADDPDLVAGFVGGSLRPGAEAGEFLDLTDLWEELDLDAAVPSSIADLASVDGRRYWVPTFVQPNPIFYNTEAFAAADLEVPQEWEALVASCAALREAGVAQPIAQSGGREWRPPAARWFSTIDLAINGPDFHEALALGVVSWTDPRVRAVFARWAELRDAGCYEPPVPQAYSDAIARLADGRAAMLNLGEWIYESALLGDDAPVDLFSPPRIRADLPRSEIALVYGLAIPADAPHPEAAIGLLRSLVSADALGRAFETVPRLIADDRVEVGYLPRHEASRELLERADRLVQLWEFAATSPQADIGLTLFRGYLEDPDALPELLRGAEADRAAAYGHPAG